MTLERNGLWPRELHICEKTLYNWIEAGDIPGVSIADLPRKGKLKHRRVHSGRRRQLRIGYDQRSIEHRPKEVLKRLETGHWEGDTMSSTKKGSRECLLTLVKHKTQLIIIQKIPDRSILSVVQAFNHPVEQLTFSMFRLIFRSIIFDNGVEYADVEALESLIYTNEKRTTLYFAHPYCSSKRGTNGNHNGIVKSFLPKGTNFAVVKSTRVREVQN